MGWRLRRKDIHMKKILHGIMVVSMLVIIGIATSPSLFAQKNNSGNGYSIGAPPKQTPAQTQPQPSPTWVQDNYPGAVKPSKGGGGNLTNPGNGVNPAPSKGK
jgi:hypothetical protein